MQYLTPCVKIIATLILNKECSMKTISQIEQFDKPREKLLKKGAKNLKDYELVAILLGTGVKGKDVFALSREIVRLFEKDFISLDLEKLLNIHGLGVAKASQIISAIELSRRYLIKQNKKITNADDVYKELRAYHEKRQEYFLALYLDGANHLCETKVIA